MTHSLDSFITDSANSATALYTGHKSTVNALGVYADSSSSPADDPKIASIAELFQEINMGGVGIVSTAFIADATPAALTAHTRNRGRYGEVVDSVSISPSPGPVGLVMTIFVKPTVIPPCQDD